MRNLLKPLCLFFALTLFSVSSYADGPGEHHDDTPLEKEMEGINKAWRQIRRQVNDPASNASTIALVAKTKQHAEASVGLEPILLSQQAEGEKEAFLNGYQEKMKEMVALLGDLEVALGEGDNAKAVQLVSSINELRKEGHRAYKPEDKD